MNNLAPSIGAGVILGAVNRPKRLRKPTPSKCGRRNQVNAWPRVCAVLEEAEHPLHLYELIDATGLKRQNIWNALIYYGDLIERTGRPYHYKFALKRGVK